MLFIQVFSTNRHNRCYYNEISIAYKRLQKHDYEQILLCVELIYNATQKLQLRQNPWNPEYKNFCYAKILENLNTKPSVAPKSLESRIQKLFLRRSPWEPEYKNLYCAKILGNPNTTICLRQKTWKREYKNFYCAKILSNPNSKPRQNCRDRPSQSWSTVLKLSTDGWIHQWTKEGKQGYEKPKC